MAIKVLPAAFTADKERLARFEREAQLLAQLHHPNIASIFGLEESGGARALVMELVEGPTLAERLAHGALPIDGGARRSRARSRRRSRRRTRRGSSIAISSRRTSRTALDGTVKVLDFGLAKAMDPPSGSAADLGRSPTIMNSPTLTRGGHAAGRDPGHRGLHGAGAGARRGGRQAGRHLGVRRGALRDACRALALRRTDGDATRWPVCSRRRSTWTALPAATPAAIRQLLRRCLERDREEPIARYRRRSHRDRGSDSRWRGDRAGDGGGDRGGPRLARLAALVGRRAGCRGGARDAVRGYLGDGEGPTARHDADQRAHPERDERGPGPGVWNVRDLSRRPCPRVRGRGRVGPVAPVRARARRNRTATARGLGRSHVPVLVP